MKRVCRAAVAGLAVPLYRQLRVLRRSLPASCAGTAAGAPACLVTVLAFARLFRFEPAPAISLLPKSITAAMGIALSELSELAGVFTAVLFPLAVRLL